MTKEGHQVLDVASMSVVVGVWADWLPRIAAFLAIIWTLIRIYEWIRFRFIEKRPDQFK